MNWTRTETLAMAQQSCSLCYGLGMRPGRGLTEEPCNCVFRAIFRACYARFKQCSAKEKHISRVSLEANPGRQRKSVWGLKDEEYTADFVIVARRVLGVGSSQWKLFLYHFLLGADWKLCTRKLGIERGAFFHEVYRIQQKVGRAYRETEPHALFPLDEYFGGVSRKLERPPATLPLERCHLCVPLKSAA